MLANKKNKLGFTLIESMIVIAIISIVIVGGLIKRKENVRRKEVETEALKVKQMLELTRDYALTGEAVSSGGINKVPKYFYFSITSGSKHYFIQSIDPPVNPVNGNDSTVDSPNVRFQTGNINVRYEPPNGKFLCSSTPCEIILCAVDDCTESFQYKITVTEDSIEFK